MYADINKHTGENTDPMTFIQQSLGDILSTPLVSRCMRLHYGSELFDLVDAPFNATNRVRLYAAVATSLLRWAPYAQLTQVQMVDANINGSVVFEIDGSATLGGQTYSLQGMKVNYEQ